MGRIAVSGQPGQKACEAPTSTEKNWVWWQAHGIQVMAGSLNRRITVQAKPAGRPYLQTNPSKKSGGVAQAVEFLPSKC
jgi:hypothetical protein